MVTANDSKSFGGNPLGVRVSPSAQVVMLKNRASVAYLIGVALGDGNLSNPNGRATRLRVTCDKKYPLLIQHICETLRGLFPKNKIAIVNRSGCVDISCYSNKLEGMLHWKVGSKSSQSVHVPDWILKSKAYTKNCLRGLFQTDGSIYKDRGYIMVNFTTIIEPLSTDVVYMLTSLGYKPQIRRVFHAGKSKYVIRISKNTEELISEINLWKK